MRHLFMFLFTCIYGAAEGHNFMEGQMTMESYAEATSFPHTYDPKYTRNDWTFENTIYMLETPAYKPIFTKTLEECVEECRSLSNCAAAAWNAPGELCFYWDYTRKIVESDADGEDCGTFTYIKVNWADSKCSRPTGTSTTTEQLLIEEGTTMKDTTVDSHHEATNGEVTTDTTATTQSATTAAEIPSSFTTLVLCEMSDGDVAEWSLALGIEKLCKNPIDMNVCVAIDTGNCLVEEYYINPGRATLVRLSTGQPFYVAPTENACGATLKLQRKTIVDEQRNIYRSGETIAPDYVDMHLFVWDPSYCQ